MMMIFSRFLELRRVHQPRKFIEMKHIVVPAVLAKERNVLAEIHIFKMIRNKASVTSLNTFPEFFQCVVSVIRVHFTGEILPRAFAVLLFDDAAFRRLDKLDQKIDFDAIGYFRTHFLQCLAGIEFRGQKQVIGMVQFLYGFF